MTIVFFIVFGYFWLRRFTNQGWIRMSTLHGPCRLTDFAGVLAGRLSKTTFHLVHKVPQADSLQTFRQSEWGTDFTRLHWYNNSQFIGIWITICCSFPIANYVCVDSQSNCTYDWSLRGLSPWVQNESLRRTYVTWVSPMPHPFLRWAAGPESIHAEGTITHAQNLCCDHQRWNSHQSSALLNSSRS